MNKLLGNITTTTTYNDKEVKEARNKQKWLEKTHYPWLWHFIALNLMPFYYFFSWKICEYYQYAQWVSIAFLIYPFWQFVMIPIIDLFLQKYNIYSEPIANILDKGYSNLQRLSKEERNKMDKQYTWVLRCYTLVHVSMWLYGFYKMEELREKGPVVWYKSSIFWVQLVVLGMIQTAPGVAVSHELFHRLTRLDRFFGNLLLTTMLYTHFAIEHVYGHHKNVATIYDPATARFNQTVYSFWFQSVFGGYLNAWRIESELVGLRWKKIEWYILLTRNRIFHYSILCFLILPLFMYLWRGTMGIVALLVQSIVAIWFVESINYFEHYGLERQQIGTKPKSPFSREQVPVYERVNNRHSWDQPYGHLSKLSFCNLIIHSDHHFYPPNHYEWLEHSKDDQTPTLPFSYSVMVLLVLIPWLFFKIMHRQPIFANKKSNNNINLKSVKSVA